MMANKPVIGWREWVGLPEFGDFRIKAKIDTGAKTSAIHAFRIEEITDRGVASLRFSLHPEQRCKQPEVHCVAVITGQRTVRSSSGHEELRYMITTDISLGGAVFPIDITLTNRDDLGFRMLLGRDGLRPRFIIDPARSYLMGRAPDRAGQSISEKV